MNSFLLEIYKFGRAYFCKVFRSDGVAYNKNVSKKQNYFGFKVYVITTSYGAVKAFRVKSTNIDDRDLSLKLKIDSIILGDKGYVSESLVGKLNQQEQELLSLKHKNSCEKYPPIFQEEIFRSVNALKRLFLT